MTTIFTNPAELITININAPVLPNEDTRDYIHYHIKKAIGECTVNFYNERGYEFSLMAFDGNRSERDDLRAKAMSAYFNFLYQNKF
jgi:hypothetical protein